MIGLDNMGGYTALLFLKGDLIMKYTVYGMNYKGEIAPLVSDLTAEQAYAAKFNYQNAELAPAVFYHKALWVWVSLTGEYTQDVIALQMALQQSEHLRR